MWGICLKKTQGFVGQLDEEAKLGRMMSIERFLISRWAVAVVLCSMIWCLMLPCATTTDGLLMFIANETIRLKKTALPFATSATLVERNNAPSSDLSQSWNHPT
jgi:hypothetical protein